MQNFARQQRARELRMVFWRKLPVCGNAERTLGQVGDLLFVEDAGREGASHSSAGASRAFLPADVDSKWDCDGGTQSIRGIFRMKNEVADRLKSNMNKGSCMSLYKWSGLLKSSF